MKYLASWSFGLQTFLQKKKKEKKKNQYPLAPPPRNLMHAP